VRLLAEWTFSDYLPKIEPRLRVLIGREDGKYIYDTIVNQRPDRRRCYERIVESWRSAR